MEASRRRLLGGTRELHLSANWISSLARTWFHFHGFDSSRKRSFRLQLGMLLTSSTRFSQRQRRKIAQELKFEDMQCSRAHSDDSQEEEEKPKRFLSPFPVDLYLSLSPSHKSAKWNCSCPFGNRRKKLFIFTATRSTWLQSTEIGFLSLLSLELDLQASNRHDFLLPASVLDD